MRSPEQEIQWLGWELIDAAGHPTGVIVRVDQLPRGHGRHPVSYWHLAFLAIRGYRALITRLRIRSCQLHLHFKKDIIVLDSSMALLHFLWGYFCSDIVIHRGLLHIPQLHLPCQIILFYLICFLRVSPLTVSTSALDGLTTFYTDHYLALILRQGNHCVLLVSHIDSSAYLLFPSDTINSICLLFLGLWNMEQRVSFSQSAHS